MGFRQIANIIRQGRADGWISSTLGYGTASEQALSMRPCALDTRHYQLLEELFLVDSIAARIVNAPIAAAFAQGWSLTSETDPEAAQAFQEALEERFDFTAKVRQWAMGARLYGYSKLFPVVNQAHEKPLTKEPNRLFAFWVISPQDFTRYGEITDLTDPNFGHSEFYSVRVVGTYAESPPYEVHASRLHTMCGEDIPARLQRRHGIEGISVLYRCLDKLKRYAAASGALATNVVNSNQPVYKIKRLMSALDSEEGETALRARFFLMDQIKSAINSVLLDADGEDYQRVKTDFTGVPESVDRIREDIAECSGIPITVLFGRSPAGLSATGESDLKIWYNHVQNYRAGELEPAMTKLIELAANDTSIGALPDDWAIDWPQLDQPSAAELSKIRLETAQADVVYIQAGVFEPDAVAEVRSKPDGYQLEIPYDPEDGASGALVQAVLKNLGVSNGQQNANVSAPTEQAAKGPGDDSPSEPNPGGTQ